jgi:hypothetical protein
MWLDVAETPVLEAFCGDGAWRAKERVPAICREEEVAIIGHQRTNRHNVPLGLMTLPTRFLVTGH